MPVRQGVTAAAGEEGPRSSGAASPAAAGPWEPMAALTCGVRRRDRTPASAREERRSRLPEAQLRAEQSTAKAPRTSLGRQLRPASESASLLPTDFGVASGAAGRTLPAQATGVRLPDRAQGAACP
jgi:hypothetical protein